MRHFCLGNLFRLLLMLLPTGNCRSNLTKQAKVNSVLLLGHNGRSGSMLIVPWSVQEGYNMRVEFVTGDSLQLVYVQVKLSKSP